MLRSWLPVVLLLAAATASAGERVVGAAAKGRPVTRLNIEGAPENLDGSLRKGLALTGKPRWLRPDVRALYFPEILEEDLRRARLFLARRGYPDATIAPDVRLADRGEAAHVTLRITAGTPTRVKDVVVTGMPAGVESDDLPLRPEQVFRDADVEAARLRLRGRLREAGHLFGDVAADVRTEDSLAVIMMTAEPGDLFVLEAVEVRGAPDDLVPLTRSTVPLRPGDPVRSDALRETEENLRDLDLFRSVRVDVERAGEGRLRIAPDVRARKPRTFTSSLGYFSDEQLRGSAEWRHRNLLGGGRGFRIALRASRFLQTVRSEIIWPRLGGSPLRGVLGGSIRRENEESYRAVDQRIDFTVSRRFGRVSRASLGAAFSHVDVDGLADDPLDDGDPLGFLTIIPGTWVTDTSDDPLDPSRGWLLRLAGEATPPGVGSVEHYGRVEAQISRYQPLPFSIVIASRALYGLALPFGDSESVLASRRLYAGGSRSMRGYGRRRLGPRDGDGEPLGGEAKLETSVELRFPIFGRLEGAAFLDGAEVWRNAEDVRPEGLEWAAGPAVMVRSPVGPIRVDWGFLLSDAMGEPDHVVHFSVGHPY